ncbi:MAG: VOC family protein [Verrucomicrobiota bacterium]|nr:VOC family protein [Verrucomicrobiota bacterium]
MSQPTNTLLQPYLFFGGRCEEAIEFYRTALGAEVVMLMRMDESPEPPPAGMLPTGSEKMIMHSCLRIGDASFMLSDGCCSGGVSFDGFSLSLTLASDAQVDRAFAALAEGGEVRMPLGKTFWSPRFGMVADKFGVGWMLSVPMENAQDFSRADEALVGAR